MASLAPGQFGLTLLLAFFCHRFQIDYIACFADSDLRASRIESVC